LLHGLWLPQNEPVVGLQRRQTAWKNQCEDVQLPEKEPILPMQKTSKNKPAEKIGCTAHQNNQ